MSDSLREALANLITAATQMPRQTPAPGGAATLHKFMLSAAAVWALDKALNDAYAALSAPQADARLVPTAGHFLKITYTNYRGETSDRSIIPLSIRFGSTEWHPEPQWLLLAWDGDKRADREFALKDFGTAPPSQSAEMRKALENLPRYVEDNECRHEETHRGGSIWTICDECGRKWADDRGGFVPYKEPPEITEAREALSRADEGKESEGGEDPFVHGAEDEAYALGRHDGYESAIQDIDLATGGDGEFKGSTIPGETVDVMAMKARIIARFADEGTKSEGGVISAARNALLRVDTWSDAKKDYAERAMKSEGGVEGHADPASGGKCLDVKATDPRGNIDGDATCVVRQAADRQKANGAGVESGPSDPTPPDRREAWPNEWNLRREAERRVKELEGNTPKFQRDGDSYLICEGHHHVDEPCEFERYVPEARAETAERRVKELECQICDIGLVAGHKDTMSWPVISTVDRLKDRAETAERERDEARAALKSMLQEHGDYHYHTCPADNNSGPCDCCAGIVNRAARAVIEKE